MINDPALRTRLTLETCSLPQIAGMVCALGYRSPDDQHAQDAKVRLSTNDLIEHRSQVHDNHHF